MMAALLLSAARRAISLEAAAALDSWIRFAALWRAARRSLVRIAKVRSRDVALRPPACLPNPPACSSCELTTRLARLHRPSQLDELHALKQWRVHGLASDAFRRLLDGFPALRLTKRRSVRLLRGTLLGWAVVTRIANQGHNVARRAMLRPLLRRLRPGPAEVDLIWISSAKGKKPGAKITTLRPQRARGPAAAAGPARRS